MNLRLTLYRLAAERGLSVADTRRLQQLAGQDAEPAGLGARLPLVLGTLAAALGGFGTVLWIAANWGAFSRAGRFGLLEAVVLVAGLGAWLKPRMRAPFALMAFLGIGALFALFGQTYQTGADPWQLFAVWTLLGLPLCLGARSDIVWAPWVVTAMTGISLWGLSHREFGFSLRSMNLGVDLACWALSLALVALLSRPFHRLTGAGLWSLRTAITLAIVPVSFSAISGVFGPEVAPEYLMGLVLLAAAAWLLSRPRAFDIYALCIVTLAIDGLLIAGVTALTGRVIRHEWLGGMLLITGASVGILAMSVRWVMRAARKHDAHGGVPA